MVQSQFIADILDLMLDGDAEGLALRPQIPYLVEGEIEYHSSGFYLNFNYLDGIEQHRYLCEDMTVGMILLESPEYPCEGESGWLDAWTKDGFIECLQFFGHYEGYPARHLTNYRLRQIWVGSPGREIVRGDLTP